MVRAKKMLETAKLELWTKQHPQPLKFANSPGGGAYGREVHLPDWVLDTWHPTEKKAYPDYFKRREQRKQEFIERWEKKYGKSGIEPSH
ncbi:NADH dehydrogenase [ubiquinone] 1 beta subcomplex subunit 9-like isoform X2 [Lineus longissimus]